LKDTCAPRFRNEDLALHWQVDDSRESFQRLLYHLEVRSNFKPYFEEAMSNLGLGQRRFAGKEIVVADIGAGVGWASALLARHDKVRLIYAVDASENRLKHARSVFKHFGVDGKVRILHGTFSETNVPEKVDLVLLCASLHHCLDSEMPALFQGIRRILKPDGEVLIANEHYVDWRWTVKKFISYLWHSCKLEKLYYHPFGKLRVPHPYDNEHWRTRKELEDIIRKNGFEPAFFVHNGDLCKDKPNVYHRIGWHYYHAILKAI